MKLEKFKLNEIINENLMIKELKLLLGGYGSPACDNNVCGGGLTIAANSRICGEEGCKTCSSKTGN